MCDKHLPIATHTGTDSDGGYLKALTDQLRKARRNGLQDDCETARLLQRERVVDQVFGGLGSLSLSFETAEQVYRLWCQAQMSHDRDAC